MGAQLTRERRNEQDAPELATQRVKQDVQNGLQLAMHPPQNTDPSAALLSPNSLPDDLPELPSSSSISSQPAPLSSGRQAGILTPGAMTVGSSMAVLDAERDLPPAPLSGAAKFWYPNPGQLADSHTSPSSPGNNPFLSKTAGVLRPGMPVLPPLPTAQAAAQASAVQAATVGMVAGRRL